VVASEYIRRHHSGQAVLAFGPEGVLEPLRQAGIPLATLTGADHPGVVLIGADVDFGYPKLEAACRAVWAGAPLLVTSMAPFFASRGGRMPSPSGTIAAGIRHATGIEPIVVGKPASLALEMVAARLGSSPQCVAVVGDDLGLEVRMARDAGAYSVLVLSGVSRESDLAAVSEEYQPHLVVRTVGDLIPRLTGASSLSTQHSALSTQHSAEGPSSTSSAACPASRRLRTSHPLSR
jgi:NagD protein